MAIMLQSYFSDSLGVTLKFVPYFAKNIVIPYKKQEPNSLCYHFIC